MGQYRVLWVKDKTTSEESIRIEPKLTHRDEVFLLLHAAVEVEHSLMLQYLYAAYSVQDSGRSPKETEFLQNAKSTLVEIAREEMGHFLTVLNLLSFLGGPVNIGREELPFNGNLYPFPFTLEPLSKLSLAKYVLGEMPANPKVNVDRVKELFDKESMPIAFHRVGRLYARLSDLLQSLKLSLDEPIRRDAQTGNTDWGAPRDIFALRITSVEEAFRAVEEIDRQGEGMQDTTGAPSHFERFYNLFQQWEDMEATEGWANWSPAKLVPIDPFIDRGDVKISGQDNANAITHPDSIIIADLLNLRYRKLLALLRHVTFIGSSGIVSTIEQRHREELIQWALDDMRIIAGLSSLLTELPRKDIENKDEESVLRAAPIFELPYSIEVPQSAVGRWSYHLEIVKTIRDKMSEAQGTNNPMVVPLMLQSSPSILAIIQTLEQRIQEAEDRKTLPVIIVGAGPAGLSAAATLIRRGVKVHVIERAKETGGKVSSAMEGSLSTEHGVHGWWMNYKNFDRLLEWSGIDPNDVLKEADGSALAISTGKIVKLRLFRWSIPSPLFLALQILRSPLFGWKELLRLIPFTLHLLAFKHETNYAEYDGFSFQTLMDHCGVPKNIQQLMLKPFILSFDFTIPERVSAACGLSGLQFYLLPDQKSILARWARALPDTVIYSPIISSIIRKGGTVSLSKTVTNVCSEFGAVTGVNALSVIQSDAQVAETVIGSISISSIPTDSYQKFQLSNLTVYVGKFNGNIVALSARCSHAGCTVDWSQEQNSFLCPCHGGKYDVNGNVIQPPPPSSLTALTSRPNGQMIDILGPVTNEFLPARDVILACDLEGTRSILAATNNADQLVKQICSLDTNPVIVVRIWYKKDLHAIDLESAVASGFRFIDNLFHVNDFDIPISTEGYVIEVQSYRVDTYLNLDDKATLQLAISDLSIIDKAFGDEDSILHFRINRHRNLFTRYGPNQDQLRPSAKTELDGLLLAGDWTRADFSVWMQERAVVWEFALPTLFFLVAV